MTEAAAQTVTEQTEVTEKKETQIVLSKDDAGTTTVALDGAQVSVGADQNVTVQADEDQGVLLKHAKKFDSNAQVSIGENLASVTANGATVSVSDDGTTVIQTSGAVQLSAAVPTTNDNAQTIVLTKDAAGDAKVELAGTTFDVGADQSVTVHTADEDQGVLLKRVNAAVDANAVSVSDDFKTVTMNGATVGTQEDGTPVVRTTGGVQLKTVEAVVAQEKSATPAAPKTKPTEAVVKAPVAVQTESKPPVAVAAPVKEVPAMPASNSALDFVSWLAAQLEGKSKKNPLNREELETIKRYAGYTKTDLSGKELFAEVDTGLEYSSKAHTARNYTRFVQRLLDGAFTADALYQYAKKVSYKKMTAAEQEAHLGRKKLDVKALQENLQEYMAKCTFEVANPGKLIHSDGTIHTIGEKPPKAGDVAADGWICLGNSEATGKLMFVAPEDLGVLRYRDAKKAVKVLQEQGVEARIPALSELNQIFNAKADVPGLHVEEHNGSYYMSSTSRAKLQVRNKNFHDGAESHDLKVFSALPVRLVRDEPAPPVFKG